MCVTKFFLSFFKWKLKGINIMNLLRTEKSKEKRQTNSYCDIILLLSHRGIPKSSQKPYQTTYLNICLQWQWIHFSMYTVCIVMGLNPILLIVCAVKGRIFMFDYKIFSPFRIFSFFVVKLVTFPSIFIRWVQSEMEKKK